MTVPPKEYIDQHRYHWLRSERSSQATVAEWLNGKWYSPGEAGGISPTEMWRRGWEYDAPLPLRDDVPGEAETPAPSVLVRADPRIPTVVRFVVFYKPAPIETATTYLEDKDGYPTLEAARAAADAIIETGSWAFVDMVVTVPQLMMRGSYEPRTVTNTRRGS